MFTGIIEAIGEVAEIRMVDGDMRLRIRTGTLDLGDVCLGDSIATNGICLTAVELPGDGFVADVSRETLAHSRLPEFKVGEAVNLEKAMMPTSRFGGHIVTGHVDGLGCIVERRDDARSVRLSIEVPAALQRYIAAKGSITVDGVSLTVNSVEGSTFGLNIVPHTAQETIIDGYRTGQQVHLEVDIIARYLERLMTGVASADTGQESSRGLTMETLAASGFMRR
jgi:riboflavin synthase